MDARYRQLAEKVDAFFARVQARHGAEMRCEVGCDSCCRTRLSVTRVEAEAVAEIVRAMADVSRLEASVARAAEDRCAALDEDGRCLVYEGRPLVCRSHGVPVRMERRGLKVIQACELNFVERGPGAADADCVLDQQTLSMTLLAIDRSGERFDLAEVIREELDARRR